MDSRAAGVGAVDTAVDDAGALGAKGAVVGTVVSMPRGPGPGRATDTGGDADRGSRAAGSVCAAPARRADTGPGMAVMDVGLTEMVRAAL